MADVSSWLGKIRGHVKEAQSRFREDARQREAAGRLPKDQNIILTEREVRGDWDASRVLMTTLNGEARPITANDLAAFRQNMRAARRAMGNREGITARQVIDLASSRSLKYAHPDGPFESDIDKARKEITYSMPVSAINGQIRFLTNAGPNSKVTRHNVTVNLLEWNAAAAQLASTDKKKSPEQIARWLRKQRLAFDCDCERHRYFFRYVASIGGFAAGRKETGYPKIRNPGLRGVACKHVLRVMSDLESSGRVLSFLTRLLERTSEYRAKYSITQKEAEKLLREKKRPTAIKTTEQRRAEASRRRAAAAAKKAVSQPPKASPKGQKTPVERRAQQGEKALRELMKKFNLTPEQIMTMLQKD